MSPTLFLVGFGTMAFLMYVLRSLLSNGEVPVGTYWPAFSQDSPLSWVEAVRDQVFDLPSVLQKGHTKDVSKAYAINTALDGPTLLLPPSMASRLGQTPQQLANFIERANEQVGLDHVMFDPSVARSTLAFRATLRVLRIHSHSLVKGFVKDVHLNCDRVFGTDQSEWTKVNLVQNVFQVLHQCFNCMLVGSSIGNDSEYLRNTLVYSTRIFAAGCAVQACPSFTRPLLGKLLRIFTNRYGSKLKCNVFPAYEDITNHIADKSSSLDTELETTYLRYFLEGCSNSSQSNQASLDTVVTSILGLNGAAQEQLKVAIPALILNLLSADATTNIVQRLLDEVQNAVSSSENTDIASAVFTADRLPLLDSCLRETLRLHGLDLLTMKRRLMADIKFDDTLILPKGCPIAIASYTIHRDETNYPNAETFDPFRFCEKIPNSNSYKSTRSSYEPDEHYLVFGIGHHACPGRRFACAMIKLICIHLLMHYDIKHLDHRPPQRTFGPFRQERTDTIIEVRRKTDANGEGSRLNTQFPLQSSCTTRRKISNVVEDAVSRIVMVQRT